MHLSIRQRINIRFFSYYLVNGTLNFKLLHEELNGEYHDILMARPDIFYKVCCVFINRECFLKQDWPDNERLGSFIYSEITGNKTFEFESWETVYEINDKGLNGAFKDFTQWFINHKAPGGEDYAQFIESLATFVEQSFVIWANVVEFENDVIINHEYVKSRVAKYIDGYITGNRDDLEDWECEFHIW